jgi:ABC-type maltose transport system permease subunit
VSRVVRYVVLIFVGLLMLYPLAWMFSASFKPNQLKGVQHIVAEMVFGAGLPAVDKPVPGGVGRPQPGATSC